MSTPEIAISTSNSISAQSKKKDNEAKASLGISKRNECGKASVHTRDTRDLSLKRAEKVDTSV